MTREQKNEYDRQWRRKNRDRLLIAQKERRRVNKEKIIEYRKRWRKKLFQDPERLKKYREKRRRYDDSRWRKRYYEKYKDLIREKGRKRHSENKEKGKAHGKVRYALQTGRLFKKPCEKCGNQEVHAHHPDYSKPLEVIWLCRFHHAEAHHLVK